jgi:stress-induced morphogen
MTPTKKTKPDADVKAIQDALAAYKSRHPKAKIDVERELSVCIRVRIIDPDFKDLDLVDRDSLIWRMLKGLPDDVATQITMLLLLTPKEAKASFANMEFDQSVTASL